jgi:hypothetical protein
MDQTAFTFDAPHWQAQLYFEGYPPGGDEPGSHNAPFNYGSLGLDFNLPPMHDYQYDREEVGSHSSHLSCFDVNRKALQPPPASLMRFIDLPEVDDSQGRHGLGQTTNVLPAEQLADGFDGQLIPAGQPPMHAQGGIIFDPDLAPLEDPIVFPADYDMHVDNGFFFIDEDAAYAAENWMGEVSLFVHPAIEPVDFDPFMFQRWNEEDMKIVEH